MPNFEANFAKSLLAGYWIGFQIIWYVSVTFGTKLSCVVTLIYLGCHLYLVRKKSNLYWNLLQETLWLAMFLILGFFIELIFEFFGVLQNSEIKGEPTSYYPPIWLVNLWLCFGASLRPCITLVKKSPWVFILVTALAAPLSYQLGSHLNNKIELGEPHWNSMLIIGLTWGLSMSLVSFTVQYFFSRQPHAR